MEAIPLLLAAAPKAVLLGAVAAVPTEHVEPVPAVPAAVDVHEVAPAAASLPQAAGSPEVAPDLGSHDAADGVEGGQGGAEGGQGSQGEVQPEAQAEPHAEVQPATEPQPAVEPQPTVEPQPPVEPSPKVEAQPAESKPEEPAVEPPKLEAVEDANPVAKASFTSEPTQPLTDETSQTMYITQKIHDYFSGGIAPSDVKSVMKETVTVLREVEKLSH